MLVIQAITKEF